VVRRTSLIPSKIGEDMGFGESRVHYRPPNSPLNPNTPQ
jgi:hypothetical protein